MRDNWLTVTQAAARVRRSRRTIETWIAKGLTTTEVTTGRKMVRYVSEDELLAYFRGTFSTLHGRPIGVEPQAEQVAAHLSNKYGVDDDFTVTR